jgi:hypothetical protein
MRELLSLREVAFLSSLLPWPGEGVGGSMGEPDTPPPPLQVARTTRWDCGGNRVGKNTESYMKLKLKNKQGWCFDDFEMSKTFMKIKSDYIAMEPSQEKRWVWQSTIWWLLLDNLISFFNPNNWLSSIHWFAPFDIHLPGKPPWFSGGKLIFSQLFFKTIANGWQILLFKGQT